MDKFFTLDQKTKSQYIKLNVITIPNGWDAVESERSVSADLLKLI